VDQFQYGHLSRVVRSSAHRSLTRVDAGPDHLLWHCVTQRTTLVRPVRRRTGRRRPRRARSRGTWLTSLSSSWTPCGSSGANVRAASRYASFSLRQLDCNCAARAVAMRPPYLPVWSPSTQFSESYLLFILDSLYRYRCVRLCLRVILVAIANTLPSSPVANVQRAIRYLPRGQLLQAPQAQARAQHGNGLASMSRDT
jgi:hypothetical protein